MKTEPTETDREAGRAFVPWSAMRVMWTAKSKRWERIADGTAHTGHPFAIDTDDPASVGCMLAQVEAAAGGPVDIWAHSRHSGLQYDVDTYDGATLGWGSTRGAALVAVMNALKPAPCSAAPCPHGVPTGSQTPQSRAALVAARRACG